MKKIIQLAMLLIPFQSYAALDTYLELPITDGITAYPSIEVNLRYDDNIFSADDGDVETSDGRIVDPVRSSWITEINPEIVLRGRNGLHTWDIAYHGEYGWYKDSENDNYDDHLLTSNLHLEANSRHQLDFGFDVLYLHQDRGTGITDGATSGNSSFSNAPDTYRDTIIKAGYTFGGDQATGRVVVDGSLLDKTYTNNRDRTKRYDRQEADIGATFYYRLSPITSLVFLGNYKDIDYEVSNYNVFGSLDSTEQRYEAGASWESTAVTRLRGTIGQTYKDFSSSLRQSRNFTTWQVSGQWLPKTYSRFQLLASSRPLESEGTGDYTQNKSIELDWNHDWSYKTSTNLAVVFEQRLYEGSVSDNGSKRDDNIQSYQVDINYQFKKSLVFGLNYEYRIRDSNTEGYDYKNNQIMFTSRLGL